VSYGALCKGQFINTEWNVKYAPPVINGLLLLIMFEKMLYTTVVCAMPVAAKAEKINPRLLGTKADIEKNPPVNGAGSSLN